VGALGELLDYLQDGVTKLREQKLLTEAIACLKAGRFEPAWSWDGSLHMTICPATDYHSVILDERIRALVEEQSSSIPQSNRSRKPA
jgi:hypothetical protein